MSVVNLPDGQTFVVRSEEHGFSFEPGSSAIHEQSSSKWSVVFAREDTQNSSHQTSQSTNNAATQSLKSLFTPSIQHDSIYISSTSTQPEDDSVVGIAYMLWVSLYWYFQQDRPSPYLDTPESKATPLEAKPKGEWCITVQDNGIIKQHNALHILERTGLVSLPEVDVESTLSNKTSWKGAFVSHRAFWQLHLGIFHSAHPPSTSRISYHCPPAPLQYTSTNGIYHPLRAKSPQPGELLYSRFIPSAGQYLSFRAASLSASPTPYAGPTSSSMPPADPARVDLLGLSDTGLLQRWLSNPRVSKFWGEYHDDFLPGVARLRHSYAVIAMWDGVPFGYFEVYWVREDELGRRMGSLAEDFDRGFHVLIGEEWARGRCPAWISSVVHWLLGEDPRTMNMLLEPRVDNVRFLKHLENAGFSKDGKVLFAHKTSWLCRLRRAQWDGPAM